jgi:transposase-like protein
MDNKSKRSTALESYIRCRGTKLPVKFPRYCYPNGDMFLYCPFCNNEHEEYHPIFRRYSDNLATYEITAAFSCKTCYSVIQDMEAKLYSSSDPFNKAIMARDAQKNARIDHLILEGKISSDSYYYLDHLNSRYEMLMEDVPKFDHCYFCEGEIKPSGSGNAFWVPVGSDMYAVDGGTMSACQNCFEDIMHRIPERDLRKFYEVNFKTVDCPSCRQPYYITPEENHMRDLADYRRDAYQCGPCAYNYLHTYGHSDGLLIAKKNVGSKLERYVDSKCQQCGDLMSIDQMLTSEFVYSHYVNSDEEHVCDNCRAFGIPATVTFLFEKTVTNIAKDSKGVFHFRKRNREGVTEFDISALNEKKFKALVDKIIERGDDWRPQFE